MADPIDFSQWIPIFPLPNAVLMPKAVLPLHVFEQRYREMTRDTLAGSRLITIALLKPGFEPNYDRLDVDIHPDVCIGRVLRSEQLPDGRFNLLVQGVHRARVIEENADLEYRRGRLLPIEPTRAQPEVECALRRRIWNLLSETPLREFAIEKNWMALFKCPDLNLSDIADVLASAALPDVTQKQRFLAESCVVKRAACISEVLGRIGAELKRRDRIGGCSTTWPPRLFEN